MKKIVFLLLACLILIACKNDKKEDGHSHHTKDVPKTQEDSLFADIMDGHNVGMAKYSKLEAMQKKVNSAIDSINKIPAKEQQAATPYKAKLDSVSKELSYAIFAMDKWMEEFKMDSAKNDKEQRLKYLMDEKQKVGKVKEAILQSLEKAESLIN